MLRRQMNDDEKQLRKENGKKIKNIQEQGMCPSCYNIENGGVYSDNKNRILYEDSLVQCFLEEYPRTPGHTIILVKQHYEDISEMPLFIGTQVIQCTRAIVHCIKKVLGAEKVYMCTMCDGGRNHLHFQLIPRYSEDMTGSKLFVKERGIYVEDANLVVDLRKSIRLYLDPNTDYTEPSEEFYRYNGEQNRRVISEILKREEKYTVPEVEIKKEIIEEPVIKKNDNIQKEEVIAKVEENKINELEKAAARTYSEEKNEYLKNLEMSNKEIFNNENIEVSEEKEEIQSEEKKEVDLDKKIDEALNEVPSSEDPILQDAIEYVVKNRNASPNAIQKKFGIAYFRAVKLIEEMEKQGLVSPYNKVTRKREILVKNENEPKIEVKNVINETRETNLNGYTLDIEKVSEKIEEKIEEIDPIFEEVIDYCVEINKFELADIQTEFTIGYTRALSIFDSLKYLEIIEKISGDDKTIYKILLNDNQAYTLKEILKEKREEKALEYVEEEKESAETINYFSNKNYVDNEIFNDKNIENIVEDKIDAEDYISEMKKRDPKDIVNKIFEEYKQSRENTDNAKEIEESVIEEVKEEVTQIKEGSISFEVTDNRKTEIITVEDTAEVAKNEEIEKEKIDEEIKKDISLKEKKDKIKQIIGNAFSKKDSEEQEDEEIQNDDEISTETYLKNELNKIKEDTIQDEEISKIEENIDKNFEMLTSKIQNEDENDLSEKIEKIETYLEEDELLKDAIEEAIDSNNASATFIQRKLRITYVRAIRLLDMMQDIGVINKFVAGEPRRVLLTYKEWLEIKQTLNIK